MVPRRSVGWSKANMPRSKRGRSAPDYDSDHEDHLAASDDDDALMDDDDEEALTDDEEEEVFEECEEMDEDEDDDIDQCSDGRRVLFPPGSACVSQPLRLRSGTSLLVAAGATRDRGRTL